MFVSEITKDFEPAAVHSVKETDREGFVHCRNLTRTNVRFKLK